MEKKLQELTERLNSQAGQPVDEELVREHLLTLIKSWVYKCQDNVRAVDREIEILEGKEKMRGDPSNSVARQPGAAPPPPRQPMKPIVITKDMLQVYES